MYPKVSTVPRIILFAALLNLVIAPLVYAASDGSMGRGTAYALGLLGIVVMALAIYLAWVIVQPERF